MQTEANDALLDVRAILAGGGTPCGAIDEAVDRLKPGQSLVLLVPFEPVPLYDKLGQLGFNHQSEELADGTWRVVFRPTANPPAPGTRAKTSCACSGHL